MNTQDEAPHLVNNHNCMDESESYWRQFLFCSDGHCVAGVGRTAIEASQSANLNRDKHEKFLTLTAKQKVREIFGKYKLNEYPSQQDQAHLLRAYAELLDCI